MTRENTQKFRAKIYKVGINRCVDVPERVTHALGNESHVPVKGEVEKEELCSTLTPRGGGRHRLFIHSRIWKKLGVDSGAVVRVSLKRDRKSREIKLPLDIAAALPKGSDARAAFMGMTGTFRLRFVEWITAAKRPETRKKRIRTAVQRLLEHKKK